MKGRSLFNIVLKIMGITFIKDLFLVIPILINAIYAFGDGFKDLGVSELLYSALMVLIYGLIIYYLVFRTDLVIRKLRLVEKMPEDPVPLNIHRSTVLTIAVLVAGFLLIILAIPQLVRGLSDWYQYNHANRDMGFVPPFNYSIIVMNVAEILIGLLLIGNERLIVNFIERKQRKKSAADQL